MSLEQAYIEIQKLVKDFKAGEKHFLSNAYQEIEVRKDFIDKFFIALGWDVYHDQQKNPYEQEVKVEKGVSISGAQKRADYSFALAPNYRDPKFYVEAKKPAKDLYNSDYYFQTVRYAWHKAIPLSVLTDFEEFHILDCRFSPDITTILTRKVKQYHYSEYSDKEKYAEIYWLFSREAVSDNSLEKFAEGLPKPRGKAFQKTLFPLETHLTIDDAFLLEIDEIREKLAKAFKKNDDSLNSEELTEAVQRTINRLVFIRFLEDKLIEQNHYVDSFGEKEKAWDDFISLCRLLNTKYNGIVFKECFIDDDKKFKGPVDSEFHSICQDICHLNSRFLYNEIPIHILGSIYERFLGKVVNATDKRVKVEEKPEVRKAGGVYYTPKYIVDYIVQNTVSKLIKGKTPEQISKMHFADIACGSGSFLIGVLDCLLNYHSKYYQENPKKAKKDGCHCVEGLWVLSIKQKKNILFKNIFGVDIDSQAVEVTQLSLALKMLEDETTATANEMKVFFHEKILPNMSKNIICGNSLIERDILNPDLFDGHKKQEQDINPLNFESTFSDIMNNGGFDAIIGNPPYRLMQPNEIDRLTLDYLRSHYTLAKFKIDLYHLFIQKAISKSKLKGLIGYIIPSTLLINVYVQNLREWIRKNCIIKNISLTREKVFIDADVYTCVVILEKGIAGNKHEILTSVNLEKAKNSKELNYKKLNQNIFGKTEGNVWNILLNNNNVNIIDKIESVSSKLNTIAKINRGIVTGDRDKYFSNKKINKKYVPIFTGGDIFRYFSNSISEYVLFERPSNAGGCWDEAVHFAANKILIRQIGSEPTATYINEPIAVTANIFTVISDSENNNKFILGILNSKLIKFYWQLMFSDFKDTFPQVTIFSLNQLPIVKTNSENKKKVVQFVNQMLQAKMNLQTAVIDKDKSYYDRACNELDSKIDSLVYELYGVTADEIKFVEKFE